MIENGKQNRLKRFAFDDCNRNRNINQITFVEGHRGCIYDTENTLNCFQKAIDLGCESVWKTKDNVLVVIHGNEGRIDEHTTGKGHINDVDYNYVNSLEVIDGDFRGKMPSLEDVFNFCKDKVFMNVEIKDKNFKETTDLLVDLIKKHKNENQLCISSFHHEYNKELLQFPLNIQFQFLYNSELKLEYPSEETYKNNKRGTVNMFYGYITEDIVKEAHSKNFGVMAWCNKKKNDKVKVEEDEETFLNLMKMGVDIICSNKPEVAINARKKFIESLSLSEGTSEGLSEGIPVSN